MFENFSDNEENCDETVSSSENKINNRGNLEENVDDESDNALSKSINSPNVSSTNHEEEEKSNISDQEGCSTNDQRSGDSPNGKQNGSCTLSEERDVLDVSDNNSSTKNSIHDEESRESEANIDTTGNQCVSENKEETSDPLGSEKKDGENETNSNSKEDNADTVTNNASEVENKSEKETRNNEECEGLEKNAVCDDFPLLKETLTKDKKDNGTEDKEAESEMGL